MIRTVTFLAEIRYVKLISSSLTAIWYIHICIFYPERYEVCLYRTFHKILKTGLKMKITRFSEFWDHYERHLYVTLDLRLRYYLYNVVYCEIFKKNLCMVRTNPLNNKYL